MKGMISLFIITLCLFNSSFAQESDTVAVADTIPVHSPTKATLMSLALPGLGQAYNKKYWKIPLVYALIGTSLYYALDQRSKFEDFKSAYVKRVDDDPTTIDTKYDDIYTDAKLLSLINFHRKNRDLMFVLTGVAYALNVVDAAVDAHLYNFDVSDDLAGSIKPSFQYSLSQQTYIPSLTLSLKFAKKPHRQAF